MEKMLGVMLDCSRNGVLRPEAVKKFADIIAKMGYNTIMLYTEDTYEVEGQPFFGHLRGRYTAEELRDIDDYCHSLGIELIPCIQTLAHLNAMFKWQGQFWDVFDCDDILLCGEEKTYELIEAMLSSLSKCFRSRKIHIGMDEAYRVGTGRYLAKNEPEDRFEIINRHLHKVCDICKKYSLEPMIWSDMFCKLALDIENQYEDADASKILEKSGLPENISLVYWDYYSEDTSRYATQIDTNKVFDRPVYFAGGAWTWKSFAPDNKFSISATRAAFSACRDRGVDGVFLTMWGDDGAECSPFSVLPTLMYAAELWRGNEDMEEVKRKFREIVGCSFDSFMLFDRVDTPGGRHTGRACRYILYNDIFMGIRDFLCDEADTEYYKNLAEEISSVREQGEFGYLFDTYSSLCRVLSVKSNLGNRIRRAFLDGDREGLKTCISQCDELITLLDSFHNTYRIRWFRDCKEHGFDVQDIRIGALRARVIACRDRLLGYLAGEYSDIPELREPVLCEKNGSDFWARIATPNVLMFGV